MKTLLTLGTAVLLTVQVSAQQFGLLTSKDFHLEEDVQKVEESHYGPGEKLKEEVEVQFGKKGKVESIKKVNPRYGNADFKYIYASGKLIKIEEWTGSEVPETTTTYTYAGKRITSKDDGFANFQYTYDKKGRILEIVELAGDREVGKEVFTYTKNGYTTLSKSNRIMEVNATTVYEDGKLISLTCDACESSKNTYDEHGNVIRSVRSDRTYEEEYITTYVYDERGNWIEKIEKMMIGTEAYPAFHIKRKITYANGQVTGTTE